MVLLWLQIGPYSLISLAFLIVLLPFAGITGKKMFEYFGLHQQAVDARVKLVNELIQAVRIVKFYAWEKPMADNINAARKAQIKQLGGIFKWAGMLFTTLGAAPVIATGTRHISISAPS